MNGGEKQSKPQAGVDIKQMGKSKPRGKKSEEQSTADTTTTTATSSAAAPTPTDADADADDASIFSTMMHLQDPLKGGETNFYSGSTGAKLTCSFSPVAGFALFHGHGDRCMIHEGALVRNGVKYLLRTDVLFPIPT